MKKILILSYFFPPSNFAGSFRIEAWAKYLNSFGYYPVIVTRCWNENQSDLTMEIKYNSFSHEKFSNYEVYRIPYRRNLRDRVYASQHNFLNKGLSKILTLVGLVFQNYSNAFIPYSNLYEFCDLLLSEDKTFSHLLISGRPFQLFRFGWLLNKKHHIKWIADYRDPWSNSPWIKKDNFVEKFILKLEKTAEQKWLSNASAIISCSEYLVDIIGQYVGKKGYLILNGFEPDDYKTAKVSLPKDYFEIIYNGTLYETQHVEIFLEALKEVITAFKDRIHIKIKFPGLLPLRPQVNKIEKAMAGFENNYEILARITKSEIISMQQNADLLLMVGHTDIIGTYSSKIFEYLACQRPILLCPSDNDVLEKLILTTKTGIVCADKENAVKGLTALVTEKITFGTIHLEPVKEEVDRYTRKLQTQVLALSLDEI